MAYIRNTFLDLGLVDVDNNEISENELSLSRWIADASLLLSSDKESCNFQKKFEIPFLNAFYIPDMYYEKGIKALLIQGRTIIQLKENLLLETEIYQSKIIEYLISEELVDNIIVVYIHADSNVAEATYEGKVQFVNATLFIDRIKDAIREGKGDVIPIQRKDVPSWEITREYRLTKAINDFNRYNSILFLGAGVSASANLPDWKGLLRNLIQNEDVIKANDFDEIYKEMDCSNLMTARYIQKGLNGSDSVNIAERLRCIFYSHNERYESELVSEICNMILKQNKIRSAITYNYDTIIEDAIRLKGGRCFSVYRNNRDEDNSFPIYHVHGVVFPEVKSNQTEEVILSEVDYHRVYTEVFDWSNVEQLHALTRCTCFFIGLSMKDPNLRRLLEIAKRYSGNAVRHYVFLERKSFTDDIKKSDVDFQIRENIMADLGLNVIWYKGNDNHKELPELLKQFYETSKCKKHLHFV